MILIHVVIFRFINKRLNCLQKIKSCSCIVALSVRHREVSWYAIFPTIYIMCRPNLFLFQYFTYVIIWHHIESSLWCHFIESSFRCHWIIIVMSYWIIIMMSSYSIVTDDVIIVTLLTIDPHGLRLKESTEDARFEKLNYCLQHSIFGNQFNFQGLHFEVHSIFNLLVANTLIIKCNIQLSICIR